MKPTRRPARPTIDVANVHPIFRAEVGGLNVRTKATAVQAAPGNVAVDVLIDSLDGDHGPLCFASGFITGPDRESSFEIEAASLAEMDAVIAALTAARRKLGKTRGVVMTGRDGGRPLTRAEARRMTA